jgi:hypothetical protein
VQRGKSAQHQRRSIGMQLEYAGRMRGMYVALVIVTGCGRTVGSVADAPGADTPNVPSYTQTLPDGPCGVEGITGTIPGVTLTIRSSSCVYPYGTPATFTFEVTTAANVPPITLPNTSGCSLCALFSPDPLSFTSYTIGGTSAGAVPQRYCECDVGCCAPTHGETIDVDVTTKSTDFDWSGRTWNGPSDTGNPMGDFFLPGRYDVHLTFGGFDAGNVQAVLPIEIVL